MPHPAHPSTSPPHRPAFSTVMSNHDSTLTQHHAAALSHDAQEKTPRPLVPEGSIMSMRSFAICATYCVLSSICVLHNKFLLSSIFPHENSLLLMQNLFTMVFLLIFGSRWVQNARCGAIRALYVPVTLYHSPGDWIIGLCYSFNVLTGMWCLNYLSVPMFSSIKRCNVIVVWVIEAVFSPTSTTRACFMPLMTLLSGTGVMSYYDLQFSALGYLFGITSCVFQSASFELGKRLVNHGKDLWSVLMINSLVSTVVQFVYMTAAGELPLIWSVVGYLTGYSSMINEEEGGGGHVVPLFLAHLKKGDPVSIAAELSPMRLGFHLLFNAALIMFMNYSIFLNCSVNSPLAHAVTGNVKAVLTVVSGILLFAVPMRPMAGVGILIGFVGGGWFSFVKLQEEMRKRAAKLQPKVDTSVPVNAVVSSPVVDDESTQINVITCSSLEQVEGCKDKAIGIV